MIETPAQLEEKKRTLNTLKKKVNALDRNDKDPSVQYAINILDLQIEAIEKEISNHNKRVFKEIIISATILVIITVFSYVILKHGK